MTPNVTTTSTPPDDPTAGGEPRAEAPPPAALAPALARFAAGDFDGARRAARALLAAGPPAEVEAAARALLAHLAPDPWALRVGAGTLVLLVALAVGYVG